LRVEVRFAENLQRFQDDLAAMGLDIDL